jgi:ABC-type nitrate/sulfonate/bicarbonate transport system substrate-binding protein
MKRRDALVALGALAAAGPAPVRAQSSGTLTEITYGNLAPSADGWPLYIADQQGFFRDEGLHVSIVPFGGPQDLIVAVGTGAVNIGEVQTDSEIEAATHGFAMRIIAPTFKTVPYRLVVVPSITSWQQLKGVSVALGSKIGSTVIAYRRLLRAHHVDDSDFSIVVAGNSTLRLAAIRSGGVQATMLTQPSDFLAQSQGMRIFADSADVMGRDWIFSSMAVGNAWGAANRPSVVKFLRAYRRAIVFGYANRDASIDILMPFLHTDRATIERAYDLNFTKWKGFDPSLRMDTSALTSMSNALVEFGTIAKVPAIADIYDGSYVAAVR